MRERIDSLDALKKLAQENGEVEVLMALNGGAFTRRTLHYDGGEWDVFYGVSDSWEEYTDDDALMAGDPMLVEAMEKGALWTAG